MVFRHRWQAGGAAEADDGVSTPLPQDSGPSNIKLMADRPFVSEIATLTIRL
jgi:hypothetical protein